MLNNYRLHAGQFRVTFTEIHFEGEDVRSFLQSQSTYNIDLLSNNNFHLISFLDPQGRVEFYAWLVLKDNRYSMLIPPALIDKSMVRLTKFLISEDVVISAPLEKEFTFLIGPESCLYESGTIQGTLFEETAFLIENPVPYLEYVSTEDLEKWRGLTGWPTFDGTDYSFEIINNLRLFDLSLAMNKGCFPGQETVSKIATRRGAAYAPVLIEVSHPGSSGEILSFDKKIGKADHCYEWEGKYFISGSLLRDFRVEKMKIHFVLNQIHFEGTVRYYPLISGDARSKAEELYYEATEDFKHEQLDKAEKNFRHSIRLDPTFGDAYESLGVMLGRQERYQEAIDLMMHLSQVDPKSVLAHTNMSLYLMRQGKITEAEEQKSLAMVKSFQGFGDESKRKEADALRKEQQLKEWDQRESMFRQVLEIDPEDTLANYGLGSIAVEKGDWQKARHHLQIVLNQDPKYSVAYLALGRALKGLGLLEEAKNIWLEGIKISAAKGDLMPANQMQQELNF